MNETRMNETRMNEIEERHRMWDWLLHPLVAFSMAIQLVLIQILFWTWIQKLWQSQGDDFVTPMFTLDIRDPEAVASWSSWTEDWDTMVEGPAETGGADHE